MERPPEQELPQRAYLRLKVAARWQTHELVEATRSTQRLLPRQQLPQPVLPRGMHSPTLNGTLNPQLRRRNDDAPPTRQQCRDGSRRHTDGGDPARQEHDAGLAAGAAATAAARPSRQGPATPTTARSARRNKPNYQLGRQPLSRRQIPQEGAGRSTRRDVRCRGALFLWGNVATLPHTPR